MPVNEIPATSAPAGSRARTVLSTLAAAQFLMTLDSSVMNVSIATVASDVGTSVTGIQTAITLYCLVMASLMITGGRLGAILGRRKAFGLGCLVYGAGSGLTAVAPNLPVLLVGWSLLEGMGAALIMPAIVALVASNFAHDDRPKAYGLVAASGAVAVATGPLIGGLLTTYASWRLVFAGEVAIVAFILVLARRMHAAPRDPEATLDLVGTGLSATGLGLVVLGFLKGGSWGFVVAKPSAPVWLGVSPVVWLVASGLLVLAIFLAWIRRRAATPEGGLLDPALLANSRLRAGLGSFFFQFVLQAGVFFTIPLFLSVALGLSAVSTGVRVMPLSLALLAAAVGVPRFGKRFSPRRICRTSFAVILVGILLLIASLDIGVGAEVVTWPLVLVGLGSGALATQLGAVTVGAVPDDRAAEVGGLQNTVTNLGAAIGTALAGAVLISALTSSFLVGIQQNSAVPDSVAGKARIELAGGVPFISDADVADSLAKAGVEPSVAAAIADENAAARLDALRSALALIALLALAAIIVAARLPDEAVTADQGDHELTG